MAPGHFYRPKVKIPNLVSSSFAIDFAEYCVHFSFDLQFLFVQTFLLDWIHQNLTPHFRNRLLHITLKIKAYRFLKCPLFLKLPMSLIFKRTKPSDKSIIPHIILQHLAMNPYSLQLHRRKRSIRSIIIRFGSYFSHDFMIPDLFQLYQFKLFWKMINNDQTDNRSFL